MDAEPGIRAARTPAPRADRERRSSAPRDTTTSVALVEDQQVLAGALRASLEMLADLRLVGSAATVTDAATLVRDTKPDVLVCDYRLADGDIPEHLPMLCGLSPSTKVLVFTGWPDERSFLEAMAAGALGYVEKSESFDDFLAAIRQVARGQVVVSPRFLPALTRRATEQDDPILSRRELDVLQLLSEGRSTREIADDLILSVNTVRNHIARVLKKLDVRSRLEAVNVGVRRGLIRFDPPR